MKTLSDISFERYEALYNDVLYMTKATEMFGHEHQKVARRKVYEAIIAECSVGVTVAHDCKITVLDADEEERKEEDAERYRWFRDWCDYDRQYAILDAAEGVADILDHHIDKGRCGL